MIFVDNQWVLGVQCLQIVLWFVVVEDGFYLGDYFLGVVGFVDIVVGVYFQFQ